jgi:hypothetical protein
MCTANQISGSGNNLKTGGHNMSVEYLTGRTPTPGKITPLIGGKAYFDEFFQQIEALKSGDKLYLMNWFIDPQFYKKEAPDDNSLLLKTANEFLHTQLQDKVQSGVDIRILLWINTNLFQPFYPYVTDPRIQGFMTSLALPFKDYASSNLRTIYLWRNKRINKLLGNINYIDDASLSDRMIINTLDSTFGGCHAKFALFLSRQASGEFIGRGYTGGIDLAPNRYSNPDEYVGFHYVKMPDGTTVKGKTHNYWHDVMAKVEGTAAIEPLFWLYRNLWNENIKRKSSYNPKLYFTSDAEQNPIHIQCVPFGADVIDELEFDLGDTQQDHLIQSVNTIPDIYKIANEPEISFATDGNFELRDSVHHALTKAEKYIYVEDQSMSSLELFGLLKEALDNNDNLKIILLTMGDPADTPTGIEHKLIDKFFYSKLSQEQIERFHFFRANYTIHSKLFIIDDQVAIIGSGGFITRSMTEELEHAVAFIDNGGESIKGLRETLWKLHTGIDFSTKSLEDALSIWSKKNESEVRTNAFGNIDPFKTQPGIIRIDLDESAFIDISAFWHEIPGILIKQSIDSDLTDEEDEKLALFEGFKKETFQTIEHLIKLETPFSSLLNPSSLPPFFSIPFLHKDKVAIHEKARMELISSQLSGIEWEYSETDGTPKTGTGNIFEIQFSNPGIKLIRATQPFSNYNTKQEHPFILEVIESSGIQWVDRFPPSKDIADLSDIFRIRIEQFLQAVEEAGLEYQIISTYRPPERAYLMKYSLKIARGLHPDKVKERHESVNISWLHFKANGDFDLQGSRQAAQTMVQAYQIGTTGAAYPSVHSEGNAIDMSIDITGQVMIRDGKGNLKNVVKQTDLSRIALSYGIKRLKTSNHWSLTGH